LREWIYAAPFEIPFRRDASLTSNITRPPAAIGGKPPISELKDMLLRGYRRCQWRRLRSRPAAASHPGSENGCAFWWLEDAGTVEQTGLMTAPLAASGRVRLLPVAVC
jgi:hypothetical protein